MMKNTWIRSVAFVCWLLCSGLPGMALTKEGKQPIQVYNTAGLEWKLWGYRPEGWRTNFDFNRISGSRAEYRDIAVTVPGSVQKALKDAGIIPDWNIGLNSTLCEWVENRNWIFVTHLPDEWVTGNSQIRLHCKGLDDKGTVLVNGKVAGTFDNALVPWDFKLTGLLKPSGNTLAIVFDMPPRYLGQINWTSRIKDWKPRFYYGWDWIPRFVQVGIWDDVLLEVSKEEQGCIDWLNVTAGADKYKETGNLQLSADISRPGLKGKVKVQLRDDAGKNILEETLPAQQLITGKLWEHLNIKRWWPNGIGKQPLYHLTCSLLDADGGELQVIKQRIGFKQAEWLPCKGAPPEADPWICSVNNVPVFLQGINWTPIRPNFADLREADYRSLLETYKDLGINFIRVWGGAFQEKDCFYQLCDEMGFLLQQDFPLSSAGLDNYPPETIAEIAAMNTIATSYVKRIKSHVSLLFWCGGNELYELGDSKIVTDKHPMIAAIKRVVLALDPGRRLVPSSPSGNNIWGGRGSFGKGINWDTHGPWTLPFSSTDSTMKAVEEYWQQDDALMHSEVGVPGAQSVELMNKYRGIYPALPADRSNPVWNQYNWWLDEWNDFLRDHGGKEPADINEYVAWSQDRQTKGLVIALKACKSRFPACGGFVIWMGHDSYPAFINTSIIDFEGRLKPVAYELAKIWKQKNKF